MKIMRLALGLCVSLMGFGCATPPSSQELLDGSVQTSALDAGLARPDQWTPVNTTGPHPAVDPLENIMPSPDGAFVIRYAVTSQTPYYPFFLLNAWFVQPFDADAIALNAQGGLDLNPAFGPLEILEQAPFSPIAPFPANQGELAAQGMGLHASLDVRFDVEVAKAMVARVTQSYGLPAFDFETIPYRSNGLFPDPAGQFWTYPFFAATHTFNEPAITGAAGPVIGIRTGIVTLNADKSRVYNPGTFMLEPLQHITTKDLWIYPDHRLLGIEPTIMAIPGQRTDGHPTDIAGYFLCFHRTLPSTPSAVADQIYCTATAHHNPANEYVTPVPLNRINELGPTVMGNGRTLASQFPLVRYPVAAPDGTPFAPSDIVTGAYPWLSHDGSTLFFRTSEVYELYQQGPGGTPGPYFGAGPIRNDALQYISANRVRNGHQLIRIVEGLNHSRYRKSGFTAFSFGRVGPYQWHINSQDDPHSAFPATDLQHSRLMCQGSFEFDLQTFPVPTPQYRSHEVVCAEQFDVTHEIQAQGAHADPLGGWLAHFPGHEVFAPTPLKSGMGTAPDPTRVSEEINGYHGSFVGDAMFPQERALAASSTPFNPGFYNVDVNGGIRGQAPTFGSGGTMQATGSLWNDSFDNLSVSFFLSLQAPLPQQATLLEFGELSIQLHDNVLTAKSSGTGPATETSAPLFASAPANPVWMHVAVVWESLTAGTAQLSLYVDGVLASTTTATASTISGDGNLIVGNKDAVGASSEFTIDEISLLRWPLSSREVAALGFQRAAREPLPASLTSGVSFPLGTRPDDAQVPVNNPMSDSNDFRKLVNLGSKIFHDTGLSADKSVACATCHQQELAYTDGLSKAQGVFGRVGRRSTPSILNMIFKRDFFWDGRAKGLEAQVVQPFFNPQEMDVEGEEVLLELLATPPYPSMFAQVFGGPPTMDRVALALAAFVRTLVAGDSPVDRFLAGDSAALTAQQKRGFDLFMNKGRCGSCHRPESNFMMPAQSTALVNTGLIDTTEDNGNGNGEFMVPTLRNIALTAPYFHDGSVSTLAAVINLYNSGASFPADNVNPETARTLGLTADEKASLVAFLQALTGPIP